MVEGIHDVAQFVEQPLMVCLVTIEATIAVLAHELFLKCEMRPERLEKMAEEGKHRQSGVGGFELGIKAVDQCDQFLVLVIDRFDPDAVLILPVQKPHDRLLHTRHWNTKPPASARKSTTKFWFAARTTSPDFS